MRSVLDMRRVKRWRGVSADLVRPGSLLPSREGIKELFKIPDPYLRSLLFPSLYSPNNGLTKNEEQILFLGRATKDCSSQSCNLQHGTWNSFAQRSASLSKRQAALIGERRTAQRRTSSCRSELVSASRVLKVFLNLQPRHGLQKPRSRFKSEMTTSITLRMVMVQRLLFAKPQTPNPKPAC